MLPSTRSGSCGFFALLLAAATACSSTATGTGTGTSGTSGRTGFEGPSDTSNVSQSGGTKDSLTCSGTPGPCSEMVDATSCREHGCRWSTPACTGTAKDCNDFSAAVCDSVPGCSWGVMFGSYQCLGRAWACDERPSTTNCDVMGKTGCTLTGGCTGTPVACNTHPYGDCSRYPGCGSGR